MELVKLKEMTGHAGAIYSVDGTGNFIYTASGDKYVARWDLDKSEQDRFSIKAESSIYTVALVNANQLVFGTSSGSLHIIDLEKKQELRHFLLEKAAVFAIAENRKRSHIYTTDANGTLYIWDAVTWKLLLRIPFNCGKIREVSVDEEQDLLFLSCQDGMVRILETKHYNEIASFFAHKEGTNCLSIIPGKQDFLISGGKDGYLRVWKWKEQTMFVELPAHNFGIYQITFLNEGNNFLTVSRDKSIKLWNTSSLSVLQKIERKHGGHSHAVNAIWKQDEYHVVTVGDDKRINYWELAY